MKKLILPLLASVSLNAYAKQAHNLYDVWPDDIAPTLSVRGEAAVGVMTRDITVTGTGFPSLASVERTITLEVWYPTASSKPADAEYHDVLRSGAAFAVQGDAIRDAEPASGAKKHPLVILSHGYTGYRALMFYLGEHLASHGYVVASIDHTDSTNKDVAGQENPFIGFPSTLLNRASDQQGTLDAMISSEHFGKLIDAQNVGVIGYSMGGYGALNTAGTCYNFTAEAAAQFTGAKDAAFVANLQESLNRCSADPRIKAVVALAPWGTQHALFEAESVANVSTPTLIVSGDQDDISDYAAIAELYKAWGAKDKYMLTFKNARHNIGGHPTPPEAYANGIDVTHYIDGTWSNQRINRIVQHFSLAMMDCHLSIDEDNCAFLSPGDEWAGFAPRFETGLEWQQRD